MTVRFKFRSSVAYDTADLGGRPSITVRNLRASILAQKRLQLGPDTDLVLSDAATGRVFDDDEFEIPEGSDIIIKRVPADRSLHLSLDLPRSAPRREEFVLASSPSEAVDVENFDDFGIDLNPILEASLPESDVEFSNSKTIINQKPDAVPRCQNFERSDISEATSKGSVEKFRKDSKECSNEENTKQIKLKLKEEDHMFLNEARGTPAATLNTDLPTELICSLCCTFIKEAVMIPCCQYSFCEKCIRLSLIEKGRCPKCSSLKCKVEDLLPNLTLRQAIVHFLETQVAGADNVMTNVPDGESGIQAKEASCAVSIRQEDLACHAIGESVYENTTNAGFGSRLIRQDVSKPVKSSPSSLKNKQLRGIESSSAESLKQKDNSQAANLTVQKRKVPTDVPLYGTGVSRPPFMYRKGDRTCYRCGSPNHIVRFCPEASNPYPLQTGDAAFAGGMPAYGQGYWHGPSIPHIRPYTNMFGAPGMMPYDPAMGPINPFGVPSYMPSLYAGMPAPYGFMRMGGVPPSVIAGTERPLTRAEFMELQDGERNQNPFNEYPDREVNYDNISDNGNRRRLHERRDQADKEAILSCSDSDSQTIHKKRSHDRHFNTYQRQDFMSDEEIHSVHAKQGKRSQLSVSGSDDRPYYSKKSNSELQDLSDGSRGWSREKRRHHHKSSSKKHNEKNLLCENESSRKSRHRSRQEKLGDKEKVTKSKKCHYSSESGIGPDYSGYRKQIHKEKESSQTSRHSRHKVKPTGDRLEEDRWEMGDGLGEDYRGHHHHRKRKRTS